ncbi:MAG: hypothetical protein HY429_00025 [Candidatus Levybacteria bacterium]|nr:hypothetical protein [Candidatus Levybacteria bacterium]
MKKALTGGQTLVEFVVVLSGIVVVVTTVTSVVITALVNAQFGKNQKVATQYAQEGMEIVRRIRDAQYTSFTALSEGTYCLDKNSQEFVPKYGSEAGCATSAGGNPANVDIYARSIVIDKNATSCGTSTDLTKVIVAVAWSDGRCPSDNPFCRKSELSSCYGKPSNIYALLLPTFTPTPSPLPSPSPTPSPTPTPTPSSTRLVFVSSATYTGDLGELLGADTTCKSLADASTIQAVRGRQWKAWLSKWSPFEPQERFTNTFDYRNTVNFTLVNGNSIAVNWDSLTDSDIDARINLTESGQTVTGEVWTNTDESGYAGSLHCNGFTSSDPAEKANIGTTSNAYYPWSITSTASCDTQQRIFCFEQ